MFLHTTWGRTRQWRLRGLPALAPPGADWNATTATPWRPRRAAQLESSPRCRPASSRGARPVRLTPRSVQLRDVTSTPPPRHRARACYTGPRQSFGGPTSGQVPWIAVRRAVARHAKSSTLSFPRRASAIAARARRAGPPCRRAARGGPRPTLVVGWRLPTQVFGVAAHLLPHRGLYGL